jgi:hypothetical protein
VLSRDCVWGERGGEERGGGGWGREGGAERPGNDRIDIEGRICGVLSGNRVHGGLQVAVQWFCLTLMSVENRNSADINDKNTLNSNHSTDLNVLN